jgi:hypothetical protein
MTTRKMHNRLKKGGALQSVENPRGFFNAKGRSLREPEILRNFRAAH